MLPRRVLFVLPQSPYDPGSGAALAEMASELSVGEVLLLGKGEAASGGRERPSILADAMEAVIGAVYLDGGIRAAAELVARQVLSRAGLRPTEVQWQAVAETGPEPRSLEDDKPPHY